jgi:HSP20 family molecular chaperone IbpA
MSEEWEEKMLERIANMFRDMGMSMDLEQLRGLMDQFRSQFKAMGIDEEKIKSGDVNFNLDLQNIMKLFQANMPMDKVLSNLGIDLKVDAAPIEVDAKAEFLDEQKLLKPPADDIYLDGWNMVITIDLSTKDGMDDIELALASNGDILQVLESPANPPLAQIELPHQCEDLVDWSINNGILDVTLKLTPQGSALGDSSVESDVDHDEDFDEDDYFPASQKVTLDLLDDDDDEEDDDGGIPIF